MKLSDANEQLNKELMQANLELGRAKTEFGDAEKEISKLESQVQQEIRNRKATMTLYAELEASYKQIRTAKGKVKIIIKEGRVIQSDKENVVPGLLYEGTPEFSLVPVEQLSGDMKDHRLKLRATIQPYPNTNRDFPFEFEYELDIRFELQFTETRLPSGGINHYATIWEVDRYGNRVGKFNINKFTVVVEQPNAKQWFWWAPHIDIGVIGGAKLTPPDFIFGGSIGFSPFGFGLTINDLDWRFLRISLDLSNNLPGVGITPVLGNIGQPIPLLSNLWVGPHLTYLPPEGWALSLFIGAVL
jgi:hypothetical protein